MQQSKPIIALSDHVKKKIKSQQVRLPKLSSNQAKLLDSHHVSSPRPQLLPRRSATFVTYQIRPPSDSKSFSSDQRIHSKRTQPCQACLHQEELLQKQRQYILRTHEENRTLSKDLRASILLNRQYQEENYKLKQHLTRITLHLREYQMNFQLSKEKLSVKDRLQVKCVVEDDRLKQLRHELQVYNQVIIAKRKEEQKPIGYFRQ